ncbi:unnamed protein product [Candida verbasci]|uniref:Uncharacterized protein n=1 Tax=Candida verbasci TaxID=1227364 RepID=A0A9W4TS48_9ASCO|nr:unnamed protein product [Candida verbasci]
MSGSEPLNNDKPIRIAVLGGARFGKTSIISKLIMGNFRDTYYPTHQINSNLFTYKPSSKSAKFILQNKPVRDDNVIINQPLKPVNNKYYTINNDGEVSPILVELIDTPSFNPQQVVPFLEASLHIKLPQDVLHNLANEPRRPVSTNPLLVASGASELNGNTNGYFFVYSSIPSYNPPSYEFESKLPENHSINLLKTMKIALDEAWEEYNNFKKNWEQGKETDMFSFKIALKNLLKENKKSNITLNNYNYKPSIWIVCTQINNSLSSPTLIEQGKELAKEWNYGFIAIDNLDSDVDELLALMIRSI